MIDIISVLFVCTYLFRYIRHPRLSRFGIGVANGVMGTVRSCVWTAGPNSSLIIRFNNNITVHLL